MSDPHDMRAAHGTYSSFIGMLKFAVPVILAITFFVVWLIA